MEHIYHELYCHAVFAVQNRNAMLDKKWRSRLFEYIAGILNHYEGCKAIAVNGSDDHVHIFFRFGPDTIIPKVMQVVKGRSSAWINKEGLCHGRFRWQSGYIAVGESKSRIPVMIEYVMNQEKFHEKVSFREEFIKMLKDEEIEYKEEHLFRAPS